MQPTTTTSSLTCSDEELVQRSTVSGAPSIDINSEILFVHSTEDSSDYMKLVNPNVCVKDENKAISQSIIDNNRSNVVDETVAADRLLHQNNEIFFVTATNPSFDEDGDDDAVDDTDFIDYVNDANSIASPKSSNTDNNQNVTVDDNIGSIHSADAINNYENDEKASAATVQSDKGAECLKSYFKNDVDSARPTIHSETVEWSCFVCRKHFLGEYN